jgi:hypothetical protein
MEGGPASPGEPGSPVVGEGSTEICKASIGCGIPIGVSQTWRIRRFCPRSETGLFEGKNLAQPTTWTAVITGGFAISDNVGISSMAVFQDKLYALAYNEATGAELWGTDTGITWTLFFSGGLVNPRNEGGGGLIVFREELYFVSDNGSHGAEVWRTSDGANWEQVGFQGWDDKGNAGPTADRSLACFENRLYVGTRRKDTNPTGGEVWSYPHNKIFLPVVDRGS